jgi:hypothetical protein
VREAPMLAPEDTVTGRIHAAAHPTPAWLNLVVEKLLEVL